MKDKNQNTNQYSLPAFRRDEQGIALLMTLSVLSLLVVIGLSFAYSSISSQKEVQYAQMLIKARLQGESAISKAYQILANEFSDITNRRNIFPATKPGQMQFYTPTDLAGSEWEGRYLWASGGTDVDGNADREYIDTALHVAFNAVNFTPTTSFAALLDASDTFGWMHTYDESASDSSIASRMVYLIIDESGKLDPSMICDVDTAEGSEGTRTGAYANEINLDHALDNTDLTYRFMTINNSESSINGVMPVMQEISGEWVLVKDPDDWTEGVETKKVSWSSFYNIFNSFKKDNPAIWTSANIQNVVTNLFPHSYDIEAFFDGDDDKHRFNLYRDQDDWNDMNVSTIMAAAKDFWSEANDGGIPWIFYSAASEAFRTQIAANLIDYCDENSWATTDSVSSPTYAGNDKTPYINELKFALTHNIISLTNVGLNKLTVQAELVNIYDDAFNTDLNMEISARLAGSDTDVVLDESFTFNISFTSTIAANSYAFGSDENTFSHVRPLAVNGIQITDVTVRLTDTGGANLADYAYIPDLPVATVLSIPKTDLNFNHYISVEVDDPRANLDEDDWTWESSWGTILATSGTILATNSVCDPEPNDREVDFEFGIDDPRYVSTAYIRNARMESIREIGLIHRGEAWRTINIHKFDTSLPITYMPTSGFGDYEDGDAHILSQLKMSDEAEVYGRVNINTHNENVLRAVLRGIKVGSSIVDGSGGKKIDEEDANDIILKATGIYAADDGTIKAANGSGKDAGDFPVDYPFRFRGELATAHYLTLSDTTIFQDNSGAFKGQLDPMTDVKQEEIIGKVINLLTVRPNYFTVIVSSEIIEDMLTDFIGTGAEYSKRGRFDSPATIEGVEVEIDKVVAGQKLLAVFYRDALRNTYQVVRYEYLDE